MRLFSWHSRKKEKKQRPEQVEILKARREVEDLRRRKERLLRDNHFIADVKRVLGA